ncbi:PilX N-terminal domain-containing pilus assembly protein [Herbivorax sp. ANBcel31]|uniref:PilX N-terminal domain-containing pilus assembly protein n=1 Tax=Herbivorax sp. ANBcel31 TaxID=3069754 RepID=UPI0027B2C938|nr:PilX N-terminal domain-containing pilus assembly protein [Herbivorax sp. ANBcel31]MDQ2085292.1 PilX N-terminal domain-containing pilus assembly protein [Herbivorax sp. ANBcel31]
MFKKLLKSNKGSALGIALLIVIMMSLMGISLMTLSLSSLEMSSFYSDLNKAYFLAETGAELAAKNIDQKVGEIQENARKEASSKIQNMLKENPAQFREYDGSISTEEVETYKESKLEKEFKSLYYDLLYESFQNEFSNINTLEYMKSLINTQEDDGTNAYRYMESEMEKIVLKEALYDYEKHTITLGVLGEYNEYNKKIEAIFDLIPEPDAALYQPVEKSKVRNPVRHEILKKAVVAEKNMIVSGGDVNISGDVLAFGTVPVIDKTVPPNNMQEDYDAPWYKYGGVMVGMCRDTALRSDEFGFDEDKTGLFSRGSLTVDGDVSTMSYIQALYSTSIHPSNISITGDSYARSIRSQVYANYSNFNFNNVYALENLQIDSNKSVVDVNGKYKGIVDSWYAIDGSGEWEAPTYEEIPKRTSSVVVNGDSIINFKDEIFIGGSTYLGNYLDENENPYMTGISALKSTRRIESAYMKDDISNPDNNIFWYEDGQYVETLPQASFKTYNRNEDSFLMMDGTEDNPGSFNLINRGMHFKGIWENLWKVDDIFSLNINPFNINIEENAITEDGRIRGYSNGAIIANGRVYDIHEFEQVHDPVNFHLNVQKPGIEAYYKKIQGLLSEELDLSAPRLNFPAPTKFIEDYVDERFVGTNRIVPEEMYIPLDLNGGFVYYGKSDVDIHRIDENWYIGEEQMPVNRGIIFVEGNVYIESGFEFTGVIMTSENIVFLGDSNITYDESLVEQLLSTDVNINGFFTQLTYDIPYETLESQRTSTKNISIISIREVE